MIDNFTETELTNEQWRDVDGYDGMYQVSDLGRVRSLKFGKVRVLRPYKKNSGYLQVVLTKFNNHKTFLVHRLVAQAFIPNDDESKSQINHRDECKQNNRVSNLEYCTASYNLSYNGLRYRRWENNSKRYKIRHIYDPNLNSKQNIEVLKANGIECSKKTIERLRKDLGLTKQYRHRKKN